MESSTSFEEKLPPELWLCIFSLAHQLIPDGFRWHRHVHQQTTSLRLVSRKWASLLEFEKYMYLDIDVQKFRMILDQLEKGHEFEKVKFLTISSSMLTVRSFIPMEKFERVQDLRFCKISLKDIVTQNIKLQVPLKVLEFHTVRGWWDSAMTETLSHTTKTLTRLKLDIRPTPYKPPVIEFVSMAAENLKELIMGDPNSESEIHLADSFPIFPKLLRLELYWGTGMRVSVMELFPHLTESRNLKCLCFNGRDVFPRNLTISEPLEELEEVDLAIHSDSESWSNTVTFFNWARKSHRLKRIVLRMKLFRWGSTFSSAFPEKGFEFLSERKIDFTLDFASIASVNSSFQKSLIPKFPSSILTLKGASFKTITPSPNVEYLRVKHEFRQKLDAEAMMKFILEKEVMCPKLKLVVQDQDFEPVHEFSDFCDKEGVKVVSGLGSEELWNRVINSVLEDIQVSVTCI